MQSEGGYRYPATAVCIVCSMLATAVTAIVARMEAMSFLGALALFFNLEGTVLLASAFTPSGLTPPQGNLLSRARWFVGQQRAVPVLFNQPLFYGGLFSFFVAALAGVLK